ncbi:MAG: phosphatase PAP2 family protein [Lachnospiraceae bacterium]|nr:phosphatase PAP2 family protein [Lachnospiraceae bacterium]
MKKIYNTMKAGRNKGYIAIYERLIPAVIYLALYMRWFTLLETHEQRDFVIMHSRLDDVIPFIPVFVIPYFAWFFYVIITIAFLMLLPGAEDYYKALIFMCTGMTLYLLFSTFVPTMQPLRPSVIPGDSVFTHMIASLYGTDTPTNVFPSIHVYNSIACAIALYKTKALDRHRGIRAAGTVLSVLIVLSTMFIKQHSIIDVAGAFIMSYVMYRIVYQSDLVVNMLRLREREYAIRPWRTGANG